MHCSCLNTRQEEGAYRNQDETIELALNLNLDPRKPGQALRGTIPLPHGTGKKASILVFASDAETTTAASQMGGTAAVTVVAGGQDLIQSIANGETPVATFDRAIATPDMMSSLSKVARILGPRGLMPNAKLDTIQPPERIIDAIRQQAAGMVQYRTDKNGIIHAGIGKGSFTTEELLDNIKSFMNEIQNVKPESFGKGKKGSGGSKKGGGGSSPKKDAKYYLKAHLTSTQGKGSVNVDLRTVDVSFDSYTLALYPAPFVTFHYILHDWYLYGKGKCFFVHSFS